MMNTFNRVALVAASAIGFAAASAQQAPAGPNLRGKVSSVVGNPIEGVEVRIDGSSLVARTDRTGWFTFVSAPKGPQLLLFRLLGYFPAKAEARVPTDKDTTFVQMVPTPRSLDTVKVLATVHILAGVVVDHKNRPIPGATIEMVSMEKLGAFTDSSGWFTFTSVKSGNVLLRVRKLGFSPITTTLHLEDWRGLVIHMEPLDAAFGGSKLEDASGFGNTSTFVWNETQQRIAMRGSHAIVVPREELAPFDDFPLNESLRRTKSGAMEAAELNALGSNACVLLNGKNTVGSTSLATFRTEDVEFVEMYPPGSEMSSSAARYMRNAGCRRVKVPSSFTTGVFYVVVWLRG